MIAILITFWRLKYANRRGEEFNEGQREKVNLHLIRLGGGGGRVVDTDTGISNTESDGLDRKMEDTRRLRRGTIH